MSSLDEHPAFQAILMTFGGANPNEVAKESWVSAHALIDRVENELSPCPELDLRTALSKLLKVFWFLKEERVPIAQNMHQIGKYLTENYQCEFKFKDGHYYTDCPNMLLHKDFGFSLRGFEKYTCSICGVDPIDCDHRTGRRYNGIECTAFDGRCNICLKNIDDCEHEIGSEYNDVEAVKVVSDLEIITFDLVKEPEMVFSRITEIPYSREFITKGLANDPNLKEFEYGVSVLDCHHCIDCKGYDPKENEELFRTNP
ncbi:hypothetical protein [Methylomicrobium lacus]|uniref:hypothetical protein n=1 Tax=Methylomicrobium lacus TaxID=136992 RepID=UPI0012685061|nr:hypothetical protein [Methylomicrobium lacus]